MEKNNSLHTPFSYPIYTNNIGVDKNLFDNVVINENYVEMGTRNGFYTENKNILNDNNYNDLRNKINDEVENYVRNILHVSKKQNFYLTTSWINRHSYNHHAQPHLHKNAVISGVYYLKTIQNSGDIHFSVDFNSYCFNNTVKLDFDKINIYNCDEYSISPNSGDIILFPSKLIHRISNNMTYTDRYSLAFNYFVKGEFGDYEGYLEIK